MQSKPSNYRVANVLCGAIALAAIGALGLLALLKSRSESSHLDSPRPESAVFKEIRRIRLSAERARARGDVREAERELRAGIALQPARRELQLELARSLVSRGERKEAWRLYRPLVEADSAAGVQPPGGSDSLAWYADLADEFGDRSKGEAAARLAIINQPWWAELPEGARLQAWAHLWGASSSIPLEGALAHAERAIRLDSRFVPGYLVLAQCLSDLSRKTQAEEAVLKAMQLAREGSGNDWLAIANYQHIRRRSDLVREALDQATTRIAPQDTSAWLNLVDCAESVGDHPPSFSAFKRAAKGVSPQDGKNLVRVAEGSWWLHLSRPEKRTLLEKAKRAVQPTETILSERLSDDLYGIGEKREAISVLHRALPHASPLERGKIVASIEIYEGRSTRSYGGGGGGSQAPISYRPRFYGATP